MKKRRTSIPVPKARRRQEEQAIREHFQREKPTPEQLLAGGEYEGLYEAEFEWPVRAALSQLRRIRKEQGLTQKQLAGRIGMDPTALSRIESGRQPNLTFQTLGRIARGLDCELSIRVRSGEKKKVDRRVGRKE